MPVPEPSSTAPAQGFPWPVRFIALSSIWGLSFFFIKLGLGSFAPLQVAMGRTVFGAATLVILQLWRREKLPTDPVVWLHLAFVALLVNVIPFSLFALGETMVTSAVAGIWNATTSLSTMLLVMLTLPADKPGRDRIAGLFLGFAGVLIVLGAWRGLGGQALLGNLACLAASTSYAVGYPYIRKHLTSRGISGFSLSAGQLLCASAEFAVFVPFLSLPPVNLHWTAVSSVLVLGILGTGLAYVLNYSLIRDIGPSRSTTITYVLPVIATAAGVLILGEPLTWNQPVGGVIVLAGVLMAQGNTVLLLRRRLAVT